jgi:hypothetical protein
MGAPATNLVGSEQGLLRVKPGDPNASFIIIKLKSKNRVDSRYGSGMPFNAPGTLCQTSLDAITQWIMAGAPNN